MTGSPHDLTDDEPCDDGRHVVVLDEHGAGACPCGMVRRYPKPSDEEDKRGSYPTPI